MPFRFLVTRPTWRSLTITDAQKGRTIVSRPVDNMPPIHPGVFLRDELEALDISARKLADHIHVPHNAVTGIMNGDRGISAQMAIRLGQAFGTTPQYWQNLQAIYDLKLARAELPEEALHIEAYAHA